MGVSKEIIVLIISSTLKEKDQYLFDRHIVKYTLALFAYV